MIVFDACYRMYRRRLLLTTGAALTTLLAGCSGSGDDGEEEYEEGASEAEANEEQSDGSDGGSEEEQEDGGGEQQEEEEPDPEEVENRDEGQDVLEFGDLAIIEHEEEVEEREYGDDQLIISGIVENRDDEKYDSVFVGVRAYNADGHQLDQYLDSTSDLQGGGTWAFEVKILEDADEVEEWDIGVWGSQY